MVLSVSTLTNLVLYSDYILKVLRHYKQVDSIYLDFQEAFDSVDHSILLYKLYHFGLTGNGLRVILLIVFTDLIPIVRI